MSVRVVGSAEDLGLAGVPASTKGPDPFVDDAAAGSGEAELVVLLGDADARQGHAACVRLAARGSERLVAPAGDRLWRRAPWPAADDLLHAPPPAPGAPALVVGPAAESLAAGIADRGLPAAWAGRLERDALLASSVVVFAGVPGEPLPAHAPAVLAAGRVLVVPRAEPAFGLLPGIDHLAYDDDHEAVQLADIALTHPDALEIVRAMGRVAVRAHLASTVYSRWAMDVALEGGAPGPAA